MRNVRIVTLAAIGILVIGAAVVVVETRQARQRASPHESVSATVDGSEMTITYGRPYMRGRMIFGRLIPWDRVWCPGADEATTLDSTRPLRLGALTVPPGPHTIWIRPTPVVPVFADQALTMLTPSCRRNSSSPARNAAVMSLVPLRAISPL